MQTRRKRSLPTRPASAPRRLRCALQRAANRTTHRPRSESWANWLGPQSRRTATLPSRKRLRRPSSERLTPDVDHAEAIAFGVGHDDVVGVGGSLVPVHLGCAEALQTLDVL